MVLCSSFETSCDHFTGQNTYFKWVWGQLNHGWKGVITMVADPRWTRRMRWSPWRMSQRGCAPTSTTLCPPPSTRTGSLKAKKEPALGRFAPVSFYEFVCMWLFVQNKKVTYGPWRSGLLVSLSAFDANPVPRVWHAPKCEPRNKKLANLTRWNSAHTSCLQYFTLGSISQRDIEPKWKEPFPM